MTLLWMGCLTLARIIFFFFNFNLNVDGHIWDVENVFNVEAIMDGLILLMCMIRI